MLADLGKTLWCSVQMLMLTTYMHPWISNHPLMGLPTYINVDTQTVGRLFMLMLILDCWA